MLQVLLNGIIVGGIYAVAAVGFTLVYSTVRFYHLAYGPLAFAGAYATWTLTTVHDLPFLLAVLVSATVFGILGGLFWLVFYAPFLRKNASDTTLLIVSFGYLVILQNVLAWIYGQATKSLSLSEEILPGKVFGPFTITPSQGAILAVAAVLVLLIELFLTKTTLGASMRAVGQNAVLAKTVGIRPERVILATFILATFISVVATSFIALETGLKPTFGLILVLKVIIAVIVGGMGSVRGALAGGLMLGIAENLGSYQFGAAWENTTAFVLLIAFLLFRPKGLFPA